MAEIFRVSTYDEEARPDLTSLQHSDRTFVAANGAQTKPGRELCCPGDSGQHAAAASASVGGPTLDHRLDYLEHESLCPCIWF